MIRETSGGFVLEVVQVDEYAGGVHHTVVGSVSTQPVGLEFADEYSVEGGSFTVPYAEVPELIAWLQRKVLR